MKLSLIIWKYIMPESSKTAFEKYSPIIERWAPAFDIDTPKRKAAFMAQLAHESGDFFYTKEIWGPSKWQKRYEGRRDLGNIYEGDGKKFLGRGLIQITGRANYEAFGRDFFDNPDKFLKRPELVEDPYYATLAAFWFWDKNKLNRLADKNAFGALTKKINGGTLGYNSRLSYWKKALYVFSKFIPVLQ